MRTLGLATSLLGVLAIAVLAVGALTALGCGSSSDSSTTAIAMTTGTPTDRTINAPAPETATVPDGRLGDAGNTIECDKSYHFSTDRDAVEYLWVTDGTCALAKEIAMAKLNPGPLPEGWSCTTWLQEDSRYRNDASTSCNNRSTGASVRFTERWL